MTSKYFVQFLLSLILMNGTREVTFLMPIYHNACGSQYSRLGESDLMKFQSTVAMQLNLKSDYTLVLF